VVGYICETDTLPGNRAFRKFTKEIFFASSCRSILLQHVFQYNQQLRPAEVLLYQGKDYLITRRETLDDLIRIRSLYTFDPSEKRAEKRGKNRINTTHAQ
jgi:diaminopimelate decarboxylase